MPLKTEFELEQFEGTDLVLSDSTISIIGAKPNHYTYVVIIKKGIPFLFIKDRDLERFAVNILKALKSNKLK